MQTHNPWPGVLIRKGLIAVPIVLLGWWAGRPWLTLWLITAGYLIWHLYHLYRLERWFAAGGVTNPPEGRGVWADVAEGIHRYQKHVRRRRHQVTRLLVAFRESVDAMPDAAVVLGGNAEMQWWNQTAKLMLNLRWPQDAGQRIDNLFRHPKFRAFLEQGQGKEPLVLASPVDGSVMLEIRVVPYGDGQSLLLARDITRLHRLEAMRRDFVANISHELRTPLTVIHGLAETLADGADPDDAVQRRSLELLQQQTQRMRRLVDDLLMLSRLETDTTPRRLDRVEVPALLESLRDEAEAVSGGRHQVRMTADPELRLLGDEGELRSAFSNLIGNAVKYTPEGGGVDIRWERVGEEARFVVRDSGPGIPAAQLPRLTERFYRVDSGRSAKTGGFGLGLAIVKHVLSRHEGRLQVDSRPGDGAVFACVFPASRVVRGTDRSP